MANTYTQIHIQAVFCVQNRLCIINRKWEEKLFSYIAGIIKNNNHKLLTINGMPDHVHVLFGLRPSQSLSDLMQDIKGSSSKWINERRLVKGRFSWQQGYGAFSYSKTQHPQVIKYIMNQKEHHRNRTFHEEFKKLLIDFDIDYNDRFIFNEVKY